MYNLIYRLYYSLQRSERRRKDEGRNPSIINKFLLGYIEEYFNKWVKNKYIKDDTHKSGVTTEKRNQRIILSLTSFPKRIDTLWLTIETLLRQSMKPDEIILWLAEDQFEGEEALPSRLLRQRERGLTIRWCDNIMSHKKYYYVMQEYPEDLIILVDDDFIYPYDLVASLYKLHRMNPEDIVCLSTAIISPQLESPPSIWGRPKHNEEIRHSIRAQAFTGAGTLYPPRALPKETFNKSKMMELCPLADDLWLKFMSMIAGTKVTCIYKCRSFPVMIYGTTESSLWQINGRDKRNDVQWQDLLQEYLDDCKKIDFD